MAWSSSIVGVVFLDAKEVGDFVDIGGGRKIFLTCQGHGFPTVVSGRTTGPTFGSFQASLNSHKHAHTIALQRC
jgi:hypothetical protein